MFQLIKRRDICLLILLLFTFVYIFLLYYVYFETTISAILYIFVVVLYPIVNLILMTYCQVNIVFLLMQRFQLLIDKLETEFNALKYCSDNCNICMKNAGRTSSRMFQNLKLICYLFNIVEDFNRNFASVVCSLIFISFLWIIVIAFNAIGLIIYNFSPESIGIFIFYILVLSKIIIIIFMLFYSSSLIKTKVS